MAETNDLIGKRFPVLDQGFVELRNVMGDDHSICRDTRQTTGSEATSVEADRRLLRTLFRQRELSPLEQAQVQLYVRVPLYIWQQWLRYRTAHVQQYSQRYRVAIDSFQRTQPDGWRLQSEGSKQGSAGLLPECDLHGLDGRDFSVTEGSFQSAAKSIYRERIRAGIAREQARKDLPMSNYTEAVWLIDLRNLFHFLSERMDAHAQLEMRQYAIAIGEQIVAKLFPLCWEAWNDYDARRGGLLLSALDAKVVRWLAYEGALPASRGQFLSAATCVQVGWPDSGSPCREREECWSKLVRLGLCEDDCDE